MPDSGYMTRHISNAASRTPPICSPTPTAAPSSTPSARPAPKQTRNCPATARSRHTAWWWPRSAGIGGPAARALEALLDLHPGAQPGRHPKLTHTERREIAGAANRVAGDTIRRHHEHRLALTLGIELHRRVRAGDATTHATPDNRLARHLPPPADSFRPRSPAEHHR